MGVLSNKFVINKGLVNEFIITIKQNNETLPMVIDPSDVFEVILYKLSDESEAGRISLVENTNGVIEIYDAPNGQILVKLYDALCNNLVSEKGTKADRYYLKPTYRLSIEASTLNNGNFVAKLREVYVE